MHYAVPAEVNFTLCGSNQTLCSFVINLHEYIEELGKREIQETACFP